MLFQEKSEKELLENKRSDRFLRYEELLWHKDFDYCTLNVLYKAIK